MTVQGESENLIERVRRIGEVGHADEFVHLASGDIFHRASVGYLVAIVFQIVFNQCVVKHIVVATGVDVGHFHISGSGFVWMPGEKERAHHHKSDKCSDSGTHKIFEHAFAFLSLLLCGCCLCCAGCDGCAASRTESTIGWDCAFTVGAHNFGC